MLEVSKKMLMESSKNPIAAAVEKEAGWTLVSALLASMPKEVNNNFFNNLISIFVSLKVVTFMDVGV